MEEYFAPLTPPIYNYKWTPKLLVHSNKKYPSYVYAYGWLVLQVLRILCITTFNINQIILLTKLKVCWLARCSARDVGGTICSITSWTEKSRCSSSLKWAGSSTSQFLFILYTRNSPIPVNIINVGMFKHCDNFYAPLCPCYGKTDTDRQLLFRQLFDLVA